MNNKCNLTHPTPQIIRQYINKAIADLSEKELSEEKKLTFTLAITRLINDAITDACDDFETDGVWAGLTSKKNINSLNVIHFDSAGEL